MNEIPTPADWDADPAGATAACLALAQKTSADAAATAGAVAMGILAQIGQAALPLVGAAIPGPEGAIAAASLSLILSTLEAQHAKALAALTPEQQNLVTTTIQIAAGAVAAKLPTKG